MVQSIRLFNKKKTRTYNSINRNDDTARRLARRALLRSTGAGNGATTTTTSTMPLYGALSDDYAAQVVVDGVTVNVNIDTGSVAFAVAGHPDIGCDRYLNSTKLIEAGKCDTTQNVTVKYGTGMWTGYMCNMTVGFGDGIVEMTDYPGGVMLEQQQMTTCARTPKDDPTSLSFREKPDVFMEGIAGLAFPDPKNNFTPVLTQLFFGGEKRNSDDNEPSEQQLQPIFGLQSCGYEPVLKVGGDGALDLGGFDSSHFEGQIQWSPVVEARYWGVHMTAVRLGHSSSVESESSLNLLPEEQRTALDEHGHARTVVDSGTSMLLFDPDTYASILDTLRSTLPDAKNLPDAFYDGQACAQLDEIDITKWPSLVLEFAGEKEEDPIKLSIPACRYVELVPPGFCIGNAPETRDGFRHDQPAYLFALGKMPPGQDALLGQALFEQYYVAHDMTPGKERIGFAPLAGCDAGSYCFDGYASPGLEQNTATAEAASPHRTLVWGLSFSIFTLAMFFRRKRNQRLTYTEIIDH